MPLRCIGLAVRRKWAERDGWFIAEVPRTLTIYRNFMVLWFIASESPTDVNDFLLATRNIDSESVGWPVPQRNFQKLVQ